MMSKDDTDLVKLLDIWAHDNGVQTSHNISLGMSTVKDGGFSGFLSIEEENQEETSTKRSKSIANIAVDIPYKLIFNASIHKDASIIHEIKSKILDKDTEFFMKCFEAHSTEIKTQLEPNFILSLVFFIYEYRNPSSFWRPYFEALPKSLDTSIFWLEEELSLIHGTNLFDGTRQIKGLLEDLCNWLKDANLDITLDEVLYGYSIFSSRAFPIQIPLDDPLPPFQFKPKSNQNMSINHTESGLLPYGDIFNHSCDSEAMYICNGQSNIFTLKFEETKENGIEIFNNYGNKSNESLILSYGFHIEENIHDTYWIQLAIHPSDPNREEKLHLINKYNLPLRSNLKMNDIPESLYEAVKITLMNDEELAFYDGPGKFISFRNEILMLDSLHQMFISRLNRISTIDAKEYNHRTEMALHYRKLQSSILLSALTMIQNKKMVTISDLVHNRPPCPLPVSSSENWSKLIQSWTLPVNSEAVIDQCIFKIPKHYCIFKDTILESNFGEKLLSHDMALIELLDEELLLILYLIDGLTNKSSLHHEFLKYLNTNCFLNDEASVAILRNSGHGSYMEDHIENVKSIYKSFNEILQSVGKHDFDMIIYDLRHFTWAYSTMVGYSQEVLMNDEPILMLLPFHTQAHYHAYSKYEVKVADDDICILSTGLVKSEGPTTIYHNFSSKDNMSMLIEHGFVVRENHSDILQIMIDINDDDLADFKIQLLETNYCNGPYFLRNGKLSDKLLTAARISMICEEDLENIPNTHIISGSISERNDISALKYLMGTLERLQDEYKIESKNKDNASIQYFDMMSGIITMNIEQIKEKQQSIKTQA